MRPLRLLVAFTICLAGISSGVGAQTYPDKPVRVIVPYPAGGPADILVRAVGVKLSGFWKQPVVTDNKAGASGIVAAQAAAQTAPDGYTLLLVADAHLVANRFLFKKLPYDPQRDFAPVSTLVNFNTGLLVNTSRLPAKSLPDLIAILKANPRKYSYGSFGSGSSPHLNVELFQSLTGVDLVHIPYKGVAQLVPDFWAGRLDIAWGGISMVDQEGRVRLLAMDGLQRSPLFPDVPTFSEVGIKGMEVPAWFGIVVPAGTPHAIAEKLSQDINTVLRDPEIVDKQIRARGFLPAGNSPEQFARLIDDTAAVWGPLIKKANISLD